MKPYFEQEVIERVNELEHGMEDVLCIGSLTLSSFSSSARAAMLTQHLVQALVPENPEIPAVSTGYEYMFGEYSTAFKKTDNRLKIIKKIQKVPGVYTLLTYCQKTGEYGIIERTEINNLAENYGYQYDNSVLDSYSPNDFIPKNTTMVRAPTIDEYQNYMYGVNAKVVYVVSQETIEDAVVVSESFAKKLSTTKVKNVKIPINDNDILLNLYGDKEHYKAFPDVGEKTKNSIICGTRRKDKSMDQLNLKNSNLRKIFPNDDIFQLVGKNCVVDIDIWSNKPYDDIPDLPAYKQLKSYYKKLLDYYTEIYEEFDKLVVAGEKYTPELSRLYAKARDYLDPGCRYVDDDRMFSNIVMEFTVMQSSPLTRGCKICGRFGNKSVVSKILPDDDMGRTESGLIPDIRMDALGVVGRLNTGQCIEQELNWIADEVRSKMKSCDSTKEKLKILFKFLHMINIDMHNKYREYFNNLSSERQEEELNTIINDRLYIMQSPINCVTGDDLYKLYKEFEPKKEYLYYKDISGREIETLRKVIVADEYVLRLKQDPDTKFSVRSKGSINPRSFLPIKSTKARKHKILYPDQSNKIGEQELNILMLSKDMDALDYFYRSYSSSISGRRNSDLFEKEADDGFIIEMESENSRVVDMINAYFGALGYELVIERDDTNIAPDKLPPFEYDLPDVPKFIQKLF